MDEKKARVENPEKTYFFKRPDGSYFDTRVKEAWELYKLKKFEYVGVSRGVIFYEAVPKAQQVIMVDQEQARSILLKARQEEYEEACKNKIPPPNMDTKHLGKV